MHAQSSWKQAARIQEGRGRDKSRVEEGAVVPSRRRGGHWELFHSRAAAAQALRRECAEIERVFLPRHVGRQVETLVHRHNDEYRGDLIYSRKLF